MSIDLDETNCDDYVLNTLQPRLWPGYTVKAVRSVTEQTYVNWIFAVELLTPDDQVETYYLRQSRNYVKGKPEIKMDGRRIAYEAKILGTLNKWIPGVVPEVVYLDMDNNVAVLTDIKRGAPLLIDELRAGRPHPESGEVFGRTIATVHGESLGIQHELVRGDRAANEASINFDLGMRLGPALDADRPYKTLTERLLADSSAASQCLVLGDLNSKNVFIDGEQARFLDLERSFVGDGAFDIAFLFCHYLVETSEPALPGAVEFIANFMASYRQQMLKYLAKPEVDALENRIVRFLGITILYRIYGFYMVIDVSEDKPLWEQRAARLLADNTSTVLSDALNAAGLPKPVGVAAHE